MWGRITTPMFRGSLTNPMPFSFEKITPTIEGVIHIGSVYSGVNRDPSIDAPIGTRIKVEEVDCEWVLKWIEC